MANSIRSFVVLVTSVALVLCVTVHGELFVSSTFAEFVFYVKLDETSLKRRPQRTALVVQMHLIVATVLSSEFGAKLGKCIPKDADCRRTADANLKGKTKTRTRMVDTILQRRSPKLDADCRIMNASLHKQQLSLLLVDANCRIMNASLHKQ